MGYSNSSYSVAGQRAAHEELTPADVSAVIVTRGDHDLTEILASLSDDFDEIVIWNNQLETDLAVYGRYAGIRQARNDVVFVMDDDCLVPAAEIVAAYEPGRLVANMPVGRWPDYPDSCLVGWGSVFDRDLPEKAFERAGFDPNCSPFIEDSWTDFTMRRGGSEWTFPDGAFVRRTCDVLFSALTPRTVIDVGFQHLPWAEDPARAMFLQPGHKAERERMLEVARRVRSAAAIAASVPARTPLTYYGGKQRLAAQIVPLMPEHRSYLEAFAGGAAVLFAKPRAERETLNDLDNTIVRFWRVLRERPDELAAAIGATPYSRAEWQASRDDADDDLEAARRLLVEVDQSFSRSRESWSIPCIGEGRGRWQPGSWANLPPKILAAATRLQGVALEHRDALELLPRWDRHDALIYCDPPYTGPGRTEPGKGYRVESDGLWERLVDVLLDLRHARVILSGYPCVEAERLDWRRVPLAMKRTVQSRDGDELGNAPEFVWLSPNIASTRLFEEAVA